MAPLKAAHLWTRSLGLGVLGVDPKFNNSQRTFK
jgi:hypothetical protein